MKLDFTKWVVIGLSGLIGVSHIGMIGLLGTRKEPIAQSKWPFIGSIALGTLVVGCAMLAAASLPLV